MNKEGSIIFPTFHPKCRSLEFIVEFFKLINLVSAEFHIPEGLVNFNSWVMGECMQIFLCSSLRKKLEVPGEDQGGALS